MWGFEIQLIWPRFKHVLNLMVLFFAHLHLPGSAPVKFNV